MEEINNVTDQENADQVQSSKTFIDTVVDDVIEALGKNNIYMMGDDSINLHTFIDTQFFSSNCFLAEGSVANMFNDALQKAYKEELPLPRYIIARYLSDCFFAFLSAHAAADNQKNPKLSINFTQIQQKKQKRSSAYLLHKVPFTGDEQ